MSAPEEDEEDRRKRVALEHAWSLAEQPEYQHGLDRGASSPARRYTVIRATACLNGTNYTYPVRADGACARRTFADAGFRTGEIIAHRAWMLREGNLESMGQTVTWETKYMHGEPDAYGEGVHAYRNRALVFMQYGDQRDIVIGRVKLWGVVYEHELGYRAEHAKMVALDEILLPDKGWGATWFCKSPPVDGAAVEAHLRLLRKRYDLPLDGTWQL